LAPVSIQAANRARQATTRGYRTGFTGFITILLKRQEFRKYG
jgi:hypothetical protein